jgi:hypothetical protein
MVKGSIQIELEKKLKSKEELSNLNESDLIEMIFLPVKKRSPRFLGVV